MDDASFLTPPSSRLSANLLSKDCESYSAKEKIANWIIGSIVSLCSSYKQGIKLFLPLLDLNQLLLTLKTSKKQTRTKSQSFSISFLSFSAMTII